MNMLKRSKEKHGSVRIDFRSSLKYKCYCLVGSISRKYFFKYDIALLLTLL